MRASTTEKTTDKQMLCAITLTCYLVTLTGLLAMGYAVFSLAARAFAESIFAAYAPQIF